MDPISVLGLVATIAGLVQFGQKVASGLIKTGSTIKGAPEELAKISNDIYALCGLFEQIKTLAGEDRPKSSRLKNNPSLTMAVGNCNIIFVEIEAALKSVEEDSVLKGAFRVSKTWAQRYRWPLRKGRVAEMLGELDRAKMTLVLGLQVVQIAEQAGNAGGKAATTGEAEKEKEEAKAAIVLLYKEQHEETARGQRQSAPAQTARQSSTKGPGRPSGDSLRGRSGETTRQAPKDDPPSYSVNFNSDPSNTRPPPPPGSSGPRLRPEPPTNPPKKPEEDHALQAYVMDAATTELGSICPYIMLMEISQAEIRTLLSEQTAQGNTSALVGLQKLNPEQRRVVNLGVSSRGGELVMVMVWETRQRETAFGDLAFSSLLCVTRASKEAGPRGRRPGGLLKIQTTSRRLEPRPRPERTSSSDSYSWSRSRSGSRVERRERARELRVHRTAAEGRSDENGGDREVKFSIAEHSTGNRGTSSTSELSLDSGGEESEAEVEEVEEVDKDELVRRLMAEWLEGGDDGDEDGKEDEDGNKDTEGDGAGDVKDSEEEEDGKEGEDGSHKE